jgi:hypothetical protein
VVDAAGNAYITGGTASTNFPRQGAFQNTFGGWRDAFVTKLSASSATLIYSTYLGGLDRDFGNRIAVNAAGNAYVTGYTASTAFPLQSPFQASCGGGLWDAFVTKFSVNVAKLVYSTYLGGSGEDVSTGIAVSGADNVYVAGQTSSTNFPLQNPFQASYGGGLWDAFVTGFSANGATLSYSTYLGGASDDASVGIAINTAGNIYVAGSTSSTNFPLQSPFQVPSAAG